MGDSHSSYNQKEEVRAINMSMDNVRTQLNGHRMGRPEDRDLEETIRGLKMEVLDYKFDNDRDKGTTKINTHILQILNKLHMRMDQRSDSRQVDGHDSRVMWGVVGNSSH